MSESIDTRASQYLSFTAGDVDFGIPLVAVREILQHERPTAVPGTPPSIRGVIDVRGSAVPVLDLSLKLGLGETVATGRTCVLVVETCDAGKRLVLGVLADAVNEVLDLQADRIEPPPSFGAHVRIEFLTGVARAGTGFVLLLDLDQVISASDSVSALSAPAAVAREV